MFKHLHDSKNKIEDVGSGRRNICCVYLFLNFSLVDQLRLRSAAPVLLTAGLPCLTVTVQGQGQAT